jgi:hypothetical protein
MSESRGWLRGAALVALLVVALAPAPGAHGGNQAHARGKGKVAADVYRQRIILSDSGFPPRFTDEAEMIKHMKKVDQKEFWPTSQGGSWEIHYMAFFKAKLTQKRYLVQFFDITEGEPVLITQNSTWTTQQGLRVMAGDYVLEPSLFEGDRKILMLIVPSAGQTALAEAEFVLRPYDADRAARIKEKRQEQRRERQQRREEKKNSKPTWTPPDW